MIDPNIAPENTLLAFEKTALRKQLLTQRKDMPATMRAQRQEALARHLMQWIENWRDGLRTARQCLAEADTASPRIGVFWPIAGEPDLRPAWEALRERGFRLALPVAVRRNCALDYRAWNGRAPTERDASGVPAPLDAPSCEVQVVLIPCVGVHPEGWRLGYGGGYFDRTLAGWSHRTGHSAVVTVGIAFDQQRCCFETSAHDRRLDVLVTETGRQVWPHCSSC
jgi:5,10-methenyltetrahydrofolate synthetase